MKAIIDRKDNVVLIYFVHNHGTDIAQCFDDCFVVDEIEFTEEFFDCQRCPGREYFYKVQQPNGKHPWKCNISGRVHMYKDEKEDCLLKEFLTPDKNLQEVCHENL